MKKANAKMLGYKVINEFEIDIASMVYLEFEGDKVVAVIDEFGINIMSIVKVIK